MQQFSLYHASEGLLYKTTCQLVEKSYHNQFKIIILVPDIEVQELLNKLIWTYSRKQFIPHGSKLDSFPDKQPIYLTSELENPNKANVLIILAPFNIEEILSNSAYMSHFQRIIIIYDTVVNLDKMINIISNCTVTAPTIKCYKQHPMGTWSEQE